MALLDQLEDPRQERYCRGSCLSGVACGGGRRSDIGRGRRGARAMVTCGAVVHGGGGHGAGRSVEKLVEVSELDYHQPQALHLFAESIAFAYHGGNAGRERLDLLERQRRC